MVDKNESIDFKSNWDQFPLKFSLIISHLSINIKLNFAKIQYFDEIAIKYSELYKFSDISKEIIKHKFKNKQVE
jgi:hypothetical protein